MREVVFGYQDGLVSTLALVAGFVGAVQSVSIILLAGLIEIVAGAVSMGLGAYNSSKSEQEFARAHKHSIPFVSPIKLGGTMSAAFVGGALLVLFPFVFAYPVFTLFCWSCVLGVIGLFVVGSLRSRYTHKGWLRSGLEMTLVGVVAVVLAYVLGYLVGLLF